jgi:hypothetical protein
MEATARSALLVRAAAAAGLALLAASTVQAQGRYRVSADGNEVTDTTTQLTWRRCAEGLRWDGKSCSGKLMKFSYAEAKHRVTAVATSSAPAWRIPTRDELVALLDRKAKKKPLIDAQAFPGTPKQQFWATRTGMDDDLNAWLVSFSNGRVYANLGQAKFPLRLVRAGS